MKTPKKQAKQYVDQNPIEAHRDFGSSSPASNFLDQVKPSSSDFFDQLLGLNSYKVEEEEHSAAGDLSEGQEINFAKHGQEEEEVEHVEMGEVAEEYRQEILHGERVSRQDQELHAQVNEILAEIHQLIAASKELESEYGHVVVEQAPKKAGKYELAFFDWLLSTIRVARMRVEDSANWLQMFASKKKQKNYWNQFKKHGTTFALSNERVVATQVG